MKFSLRSLLCLVCALYLSGAHWMLLQTAAWTGMIFSRTQTATVAEAVKTTFDGDHPCGLCTAISKGQEEEQQKQPTLPTYKKGDDLKVAALNRMLLPPPTPAMDVSWPAFAPHALVRSEQPPTPPPLA